MDFSWFTITPTQLVGIVLSALGIYVSVIVLVRINGLRSLSKMSSHDFIVTVGIGTVVASTALTRQPSLLQGLVAIGALLLWQRLAALWRLRSEYLFDNRPLLLMRDGEFLFNNLRHARITEDDLYAALRSENACELEQVRAVVMETTGDISVLQADVDAFDMAVLYGVRFVPDAEGFRPPG